MTEKKQLSPEMAEALERAAKARATLEAKRNETNPNKELQEALDQAALLEAQVQYGEDSVLAAETRLGLVIVRKPTEREYAVWRDRISRLKPKESAYDANKALVVACLVHPTRDRFVEYLKEQSGLLEPLSALVLRLGGALLGE